MAKRAGITVLYERGQYTTLAGNERMDNPRPGTPEWCQWLDLQAVSSFGFTCEQGTHYTVRREKRDRGSDYWYAYRKQDKRLRKVYAGRTHELILNRLLQVAQLLAGKSDTTLVREMPATESLGGGADAAYLLLIGETIGYWSLIDVGRNGETVRVGRGEGVWRAFVATADAQAIRKATRAAIHHCYNWGLDLPPSPGEEHFIWCSTIRTQLMGTWHDHRQLGRYEDRRGNWWCEGCFGQYQLMCYGETLSYPEIEADTVLTVQAGSDAWLKYARIAGHTAVFLMRRIAGQLCDNHHAGPTASPECKHRRCHRQDCEHTDYLGYRWCPSHFYHAALLNVGVILDFPGLVTLEGRTMEAGKDVWVAYAEREKNTERLITFLGAGHTLLGRAEREEAAFELSYPTWK